MVVKKPQGTRKRLLPGQVPDPLRAHGAWVYLIVSILAVAVMLMAGSALAGELHYKVYGKAHVSTEILNNGDESDLRTRLRAPAENLEQELYVSAELPQTGRVMVKDEDICVHCGLCAERCPTSAWDMQKFLYNVTKAGQ